MPWDPLGAWPAGRRWLWAVLAILVGLLQGPDFIRSLRPPRDQGVDFFQEWASARNLFAGLPIYTNQKRAVERYLGYSVSRGGSRGVEVKIEVNAHPPTSVLLTVPLAGLDYPDAVLVWNLVSLGALLASLWLVGHELGIRWSAWTGLPIITLLLLCNPLRAQVMQGQLNLVLLLLITGTWVAGRRGRLWWAGFFLGAATAIKLFPGFLFVYFVLRRQWKIVAAGALSLAALTALTAAVLGPRTYRSYVHDVLPQVQTFQSGWLNASLPGLWTKLFNPATEQERVQPLWRSPALARAGGLASCLAVVMVLAWVTRRVRTRMDGDRAFGLAVTAMLLVSPITWDHYFLLLLVSLAVVWVGLPPSGAAKGWFLAVLIALWFPPLLIYDTCIPGGHAKGVATPVDTLALLSFQCYGLLGLFALGVAVARGGPAPADEGEPALRARRPEPEMEAEPYPATLSAPSRQGGGGGAG